MNEKEYRFWFHYNKPNKKISVHFKNKCHIVKHISVDVPTESHWKKTQPNLVIRGYAKYLIIEEDMFIATNKNPYKEQKPTSKGTLQDLGLSAYNKVKKESRKVLTDVFGEGFITQLEDYKNYPNVFSLVGSPALPFITYNHKSVTNKNTYDIIVNTKHYNLPDAIKAKIKLHNDNQTYVRAGKECYLLTVKENKFHLYSELVIGSIERDFKWNLVHYKLDKVFHKNHVEVQKDIYEEYKSDFDLTFYTFLFNKIELFLNKFPELKLDKEFNLIFTDWLTISYKMPDYKLEL